MEKYIELAKKLKTLADRGVGGEKMNAEQALKRIMQKYNITENDLEGGHRYFQAYNVKNQYEALFQQVASSVLGPQFKIYQDRRKPRALVLSVTPAEHVEIEMKWDFYLKLYKEEMKVFHSAFIMQNEIYPKNSDGVKMSELTPEEIDNRRRAALMADQIKRGQLLKQLNAFKPR